MPISLLLNRYKRFIIHLVNPFYKVKTHLPSNGIFIWMGDLLCYFLDLFFIAEFFMLSNILVKRDIRKMNEKEMAIANAVFKDTLLTSHIFIDDTASFLTKKHNFAYVSFNLINWWGNMRDEVFAHELMHVYQFQKFGFVYIFRAILAQHSKAGYDYGGIDGLTLARENGKTLFDFNFEQQASIIEHYYALCHIKGRTIPEDILKLYHSFYMQIFSKP
jgi:hypothetical protein